MTSPITAAPQPSSLNTMPPDTGAVENHRSKPGQRKAAANSVHEFSSILKRSSKQQSDVSRTDIKSNEKGKQDLGEQDKAVTAPGQKDSTPTPAAASQIPASQAHTQTSDATSQPAVLSTNPNNPSTKDFGQTKDAKVGREALDIELTQANSSGLLQTVEKSQLSEPFRSTNRRASSLTMTMATSSRPAGSSTSADKSDDQAINVEQFASEPKATQEVQSLIEKSVANFQKLMTTASDESPARFTSTQSLSFNLVANQAPSTVEPGMATHLVTPVFDPQFPQAFSNQVSLLVGQGIQQAQLTLNPPNLGPVHVEIRQADKTVAINFRAANENTRDAISDGLEYLRDQLQADGITLASAHVQSLVVVPTTSVNPTVALEQSLLSSQQDFSNNNGRSNSEQSASANFARLSDQSSVNGQRGQQLESSVALGPVPALRSRLAIDVFA